jgi:hypothetical protein
MSYSFYFDLSNTGEAVVYGAKDVANDRAKQREDRNNNDSDQNKDQSVFYLQLTPLP